jgi:3-phenylpropionate/trans-cinnamate dioxygenase ferredoxin subunit
MMEFRKAARIEDVPAGQRKMVKVGGKRIALFNIEGNYYAIDDTCTHKGGPLSEGQVAGTTVTCPWHHSIFDLRTGDAMTPPTEVGVCTYNVRVVDDDIEIEI